jgi:hypothetical protein
LNPGSGLLGVKLVLALSAVSTGFFGGFNRFFRLFQPVFSAVSTGFFRRFQPGFFGANDKLIESVAAGP